MHKQLTPTEVRGSNGALELKEFHFQPRLIGVFWVYKTTAKNFGDTVDGKNPAPLVMPETLFLWG